MLTNLNTIFSQHPDYAVAAFNIFGYEDAAAVVAAAEELKEPVILMANRDAVAHMPLPVLGKIMTHLAQQASVPVCVHLDHSISFDPIKEAIDAGFTSVMFDGSQLSMEENISITRQVVDYAHPLGVTVEGEIGSVGYSDPSIQAKTVFTEPEEALLFAEATKVDCLAVSIGTVHRMEQQAANLQFDRLKEIRDKVSVPLVIHGSTGVADSDLTKLSQSGAMKINIGTSLRMAFGKTLRKTMEENPKEYDRIKLFQQPMKTVCQTAKTKILTLQYK